MERDKALKFWNGRSPQPSWEHCYIAAYTQRDAIQLFDEAFHGGGAGEIKNYFSACWGNDATRELMPTARRGIYLTDRVCHSRMFIAPKSRSILEEAPEEAKAAAAAQPIPEDYGKLRVGFERGVKVDVWTFNSAHADRGGADRMIAEVRMQNATRRGHGANGGIEFVASSDCFGKGVRLSSPNIEKLFDEVQEAFRTYELAQRGVVWEDWLEITVHDEKPYSADKGAGLAVGYKKLKRGVDPRNGRVMTIHDMNHVVTDFPKARAAGKKTKRDDEDWNMGDTHQVAYLPATPENIAALDAIMAAVNVARVRLEGILNQRDVAKTLASIPSVPLLESK